MKKVRTPRTAKNRMMDHLARRDHSEKELRQKLQPHFSQEEINAAICQAKEHGWLPSTEEGITKLAQKTAEMLHRKKKGTQYINNYLTKKGLPPVPVDLDLEMEKALNLVKNKISDTEALSREERAKLGRFLIARGFTLETVRKVIYEKL